MSARDDLLKEYGEATTAPLGTPTDLRQKLDAYRAEVEREVRSQIADNLDAYAARYAPVVAKTFTRLADSVRVGAL